HFDCLRDESLDVGQLHRHAAASRLNKPGVPQYVCKPPALIFARTGAIQLGHDAISQHFAQLLDDAVGSPDPLLIARLLWFLRLIIPAIEVSDGQRRERPLPESRLDKLEGVDVL